MEEHVASWLNAIVNAEPEGLRHILNVYVLSSWVVIAFLLVLVRAGTRNMELRPTRGLQVFWEWAYEAFVGLGRNMIGPGGDKHVPFLGTLFLYIVCLNLLGIIPGFISPTASLMMTPALAIPTFFYVQWCGFRAQGWRYLKHFVGDVWWLSPLMLMVHIVGELARPLSLSIRLFGNIFGEDTVIAQLLLLSAAIFGTIHIPLPLHFPMVLFHIFVSFVQALVFVMLAAAYIGGAEAGHDEEHHEVAHAVTA